MLKCSRCPCRIQQFISDPAEKRFRDAMVRGAAVLPVHQRGSVCLQHRRQDCYSGRCEAEPAGGNTLFPPARRANGRPNPAGQRLAFLLFHGGISCHAIGRKHLDGPRANCPLQGICRGDSRPLTVAPEFARAGTFRRNSVGDGKIRAREALLRGVRRGRKCRGRFG